MKNTHVSLFGLVKGCIARLYEPIETQIDLCGLSEWAGVNFIQDSVVSIDPSLQQISLQNGPNIQYDVLSIDIGSASRGLSSIRGVKEFAIPTRPISNLISRIEKEEMILKESHCNVSKKIRVVVIGGGVAGIELALTMEGRWKELLRDVDFDVTLLNSGKGLLENEPTRCRDALQNILNAKNVQVRHECKVESIQNEMIQLTNGEYIPYSHCIWATGAEAHQLSYEMGLKGININKDGWIRVGPTLQTVAHANVFAAGDCASIESPAFETPPKAGVYAVRSGPILVKNISAYLKENDSMIDYEPQDDFLKLIACGEGKALGFRFGIPLEGKWVWELKDTIDKMFMDLFRVQIISDSDGECDVDTSQYDERVVKSEPVDPEQGAMLLQRTDDDVDFQHAWDILRHMMDDEKYKEEVLNCVIK